MAEEQVKDTSKVERQYIIRQNIQVKPEDNVYENIISSLREADEEQEINSPGGSAYFSNSIRSRKFSDEESGF